MTINTRLFRQIYDQISQHPETHDQMAFECVNECGTARCVAGWAVAIHYGVEGGTIYDNQEGWDHEERMAPDGGFLSFMAAAAADILGITDAEACELFYHSSDEQAVEACLRYANKGEENLNAAEG